MHTLCIPHQGPQSKELTHGCVSPTVSGMRLTSCHTTPTVPGSHGRDFTTSCIPTDSGRESTKVMNGSITPIVLDFVKWGGGMAM